MSKHIVACVEVGSVLPDAIFESRKSFLGRLDPHTEDRLDFVRAMLRLDHLFWEQFDQIKWGAVDSSEGNTTLIARDGDFVYFGRSLDVIL